MILIRRDRYESHVTMPGSHPVKDEGTASKEKCCESCMNTTWCVAAVYQQAQHSCNMHGSDDDKPLKEGEDWGVTTGRLLR